MWEVYLVHMMPGTGDLSIKERRKRIEKEGEQSVYLARETVRARVVISAVGALVEPRDWPEDVARSESFKGEIFHSARWKSDVSMKDKNVIVVGTGCTAAQLIPKLPELGAKSVTQLMRSAPWTWPRAVPPFGEEKWNKYSPTVLNALPFLGPAFRALIHFAAEAEFVRWFQNDDERSRDARKKVIDVAILPSRYAKL